MLKKIAAAAALAGIVALAAGTPAVLSAGISSGSASIEAVGNWPDPMTYKTTVGNWPDPMTYKTTVGNWPDPM